VAGSPSSSAMWLHGVVRPSRSKIMDSTGPSSSWTSWARRAIVQRDCGTQLAGGRRGSLCLVFLEDVLPVVPR